MYALACSGVEGFEFGKIASFCMGGSGVALENSAWALAISSARHGLSRAKPNWVIALALE
ncbi:hypothetical protein HHE06_01960 [Helicobacter heilmannii]|nr:hypothetical protein HHE06_01960 [Helicobacter heilmannii]